MKEIKNVGVIGCGTMGKGIAQVCALGGFKTLMIDIENLVLEKAVIDIGWSLNRLVEKGKITAIENKQALTNIITSIDYSSLSECDLIIEAVSEKKEIKKHVINKLGKIISHECIIASNTSTISLTEIASFDIKPDRVIGMHFMNPVPVMKLVEIITALQTTENIKDAVVSFIEKIGKTPLVVNDSPGFVLNRVLIPMINEAIIILDEKISDAESIDSILKLGAAHPMGPLALADLIGLDICLNVMEVMYTDFGDSKYRPSALLRRMVAGGYLGKKTGKGFYQY